jgi:NTE family protein
MPHSLGPRIGIALGGGAARGLAHVSYVEAMDELGLEPSVIAGTSIGALIGAGWANGMSGAELREHLESSLGDFRRLGGKLWATQWGSFLNTLRRGFSMQIDAEEIIANFVPDDFAKSFEELEIPLHVVATDFAGWNQVVFDRGPLLPAIAGSIAIPSIFKPVPFADRWLVDGGVVNPLPLDVASVSADIVIGIDVNGDSHRPDDQAMPTPMDSVMGAVQIMMHSLTTHSLAAYPPDVYFRPHVGRFGAHEFWRVREILAVSDEDKDPFKRAVSNKMEEFISGRRKTT